jgi:S1-C subfamily serine protease
VKRRPLYSKSGKPRVAGGSAWVARDGVSPVIAGLPDPDEGPGFRKRAGLWWAGLYSRHTGKLLVAISAAVTLAAVGIYDLLRPPAQDLTQRELNAAVNFAIEERPRPPSVASIAYARIIPSVVRVNGQDDSEDPGATPPGGEGPLAEQPSGEGIEEDFHEKYTAVGTGVVIDDQGTILTNLHVAAAAKKLRVVFWNGMESDAVIVGAQPESDLAIIRPAVIPDDLVPATLASSANLQPGDEVVAVGFPFGIGPSASAGVVSGLLRTLTAEDEPRLKNLIQFDAAANPGNSGGPLVNADGEVVGIVTAILNPSGLKTFLGIGFAVPIESAAGAVEDSPL